MNTLAERYKDARKIAGLSQSKVADLACTTSTTISKIESGLIANPRHLDLHAKVLGVSEAYLRFGKDEQPYKVASEYSQQYKELSKNLRLLEREGLLSGDIFRALNGAMSLATQFATR